MDPTYMIFHIIDTTKNPIAVIPLTANFRVMLSLMSSAVLLARKPALGSLRTAPVPAEEVLVMPIKVFPQIAGPRKYRLG